MGIEPSSTDNFTGRFEKIIQPLLVILASGYILIDLYIIFSRILYPFELDGIEGEGLVQVYRLLAGLPLYAKPTVQYVALIYPPLYYYAAALVARLTAPSFGALRAVSFAATLLCMVLLYRVVKEKTKSNFSALLAIGCFASCFILTDQWFDIARTDMLATALCFLGVYLVREQDTPRQPWLDLAAGVAFSLAFLTKQQEIFVFILLLAYLGLTNWRTALRLGVAFALSTAVLFLVFWINTDGWIFYYFFTVPAAHKFDITLRGLIGAFTSQFFPVLGFLFIGFLPFGLQPKEIFQDKSYRYYYVVALAMFGAGTFAYLNKFAGRNVMVITYLGLTILVGLAAQWLMEHVRQIRGTRSRHILLTAGWCLLIVQFGLQASGFLTKKLLPNQLDQATGASIVAQISQTPGNVLAIDENYLLIYAGKPVYYSEMASSELEGQGSQYSMPEWPQLKQQIQELIHARSTGAVYVDYYARLKSEITGCPVTKIHYADKSTFLPITGYQTRPNFTITCNPGQN